MLKALSRSKWHLVAVAVSLIAYFTAPMPLVYLIWRYRLEHTTFQHAHAIVFWPALEVAERVTVIDHLYGWQLETMPKAEAWLRQRAASGSPSP